MSTFAADIRMWPSPQALAAHLANHKRSICDWVEGLTVHHTVNPTEEFWRGKRTMMSLMAFYRDVRGREAGPHLFITTGQIWQLTPLNMQGVHGSRCNSNRWGIEVVGNFDLKPWPKALADIVIGSIAVLLQWRGLKADTINGHRDCGSSKTCPGSAISLPAVQAAVRKRMQRSLR